jgi:hypothetical protein
MLLVFLMSTMSMMPMVPVMRMGTATAVSMMFMAMVSMNSLRLMLDIVTCLLTITRRPGLMKRHPLHLRILHGERSW